MILVLCAALNVIVAGVAWLFVRRHGFFKNSYGGSSWTISACWATWLTALALGWLIPLAVVNGVAYTNQISDQNSISAYRKTEAIYSQKARRLTAQFKRYLADQYPHYERAIFREITPENPSIVFVRYPQIRASETLIALVGQIRSLQDQVYAQQTSIVLMQKNIATRRRNPWYLTWLLP